MAETKTFDITSFDSTNSSYYGTSSGYPAENGIGGATSTTQARFIMTTGRNAVTKVYYNFDCSSIPSDATIDSVSCSAKVSRYSTQTKYIASANVQLCSGTTSKATTNITSTSASTLTISGGTWTRSDLNNVKILLYGTRGTSSTTSTSYYLRIYGATLTVEYTTSGGETKNIHIKVGGAWKDIGKSDMRIKVAGAWTTPTAVYIKQNNSWKEVG